MSYSIILKKIKLLLYTLHSLNKKGIFMDEKNEVLLNLALEATPEELEKSPNLAAGVNEDTGIWEVIIKFNQIPTQLFLDFPQARLTDLGYGYGILTISKEGVYALANYPEIEYVEKPKRLYFSVTNGKRVSCITPVRSEPFSLEGAGTLVAILDSGIDYRHPDFQNPDGTTRIAYLWDQTLSGTPPEGFYRGREFTAAEINLALSAASEAEAYSLVPSLDVSGHGTFVAGIAAGNGNVGGPSYAGVAPKASLLVVKLGSPQQTGFPRTTELMEGLSYVLRKAEELGQPVAVNVSIGNSYGSHTGTSLLETYFNQMAGQYKNVISVGSGNEGARAGHTQGQIVTGESRQIALQVGSLEPNLNVQLWKSYADTFSIALRSPSGESTGPISLVPGAQRYRLQDTDLLIYYGEPRPYSNRQELYVEFLPVNSYVNQGIWLIELYGEAVTSGFYQLWLPSAGVLNEQTRFLSPEPSLTITIPSTAEKVITVGAYDGLTGQYADFSGRGFVELPWDVKPDLAAPGVSITSTIPGGGYGTESGTSMATPFVTGSSALLMEWGIVRGNDPYLYGEKVKAYLIKGAKPLPAFTMYPNPYVGWGALCLRNSLPV